MLSGNTFPSDNPSSRLPQYEILFDDVNDTDPLASSICFFLIVLSFSFFFFSPKTAFESWFG